MKTEAVNTSCFSDICVERCKGACCDPWWGIISYTMVKEGGLSNLSSFKREVLKGIEEREKRIIEAYVTNESPVRRLFDRPERYNVSIREIKVAGSSISIGVLAMFAFRCLFLSDKKTCLIHPSLLGGKEVRPPHCGYMGSLNVRPGEKGYCRVIHAAESPDGSNVARAIDMEKGVSERHYREGADTAEKAAEKVVEGLKEYCSKYASELMPALKDSAPGRNDPCWCGSGDKYKKCHGR